MSICGDLARVGPAFWARQVLGGDLLHHADWPISLLHQRRLDLQGEDAFGDPSGQAATTLEQA